MGIFHLSFRRDFQMAFLLKWVSVSFLSFYQQMCTNLWLNRNLLCRFTTGEMRNLSSGYRGINFLVKDRLFVGRELNHRMLLALKYLVCASHKHHSDTSCRGNPSSSSSLSCLLPVHRQETDHRSVPEEAAQGGGQSGSSDWYQGLAEGDAAGERAEKIHITGPVCVCTECSSMQMINLPILFVCSCT